MTNELQAVNEELEDIYKVSGIVNRYTIDSDL